MAYNPYRKQPENPLERYSRLRAEQQYKKQASESEQQETKASGTTRSQI